MQARDAIKHCLKSTQDMLNMYLSDLSDQDITVRPVPTANNIAWQLGHLISAEFMLAPILPGASIRRCQPGSTKPTKARSPASCRRAAT